MRRIAAGAVAVVVCACSTGIVPTDQGKYMISNHGGAPGTTGDSMKADVYTEANKFCAGKGLALETVSVKTLNMIPFVHPPSATLEFRCVPITASAASSPQ